MFMKVSVVADPLKIAALSERLGIPQLNNEKTEDVRDTINNSCPATEDIILAKAIKQEIDLYVEEEFGQDENFNQDSEKEDQGQVSCAVEEQCEINCAKHIKHPIMQR